MRCCLLLLCLYSTTLMAAPRVVTSIAPVYEITTAIMAGVAEPVLIIDKHASAHHFAFKPSHMRQLQQAELVIWIERNFEAGFARVPEFLSPATQQLELMPALGIEGGDGHIWYSPQLLLRSVEIITSRLMQLDPQNQERYRANAMMLNQDIIVWQRAAQQRWQNLQPRFITDHNFTTHFQQDTGIRPIGSVHDQHDDHGGLKELERLDKLLRQSPAVCLLTLQTSASPLARSLAQKYDMRIINLALEPISNPEQPLILQRLTQLTHALQKCT